MEKVKYFIMSRGLWIAAGVIAGFSLATFWGV